MPGMDKPSLNRVLASLTMIAVGYIIYRIPDLFGGGHNLAPGRVTIFGVLAILLGFVGWMLVGGGVGSIFRRTSLGVMLGLMFYTSFLVGIPFLFPNLVHTVRAILLPR
jgi:hypothetical protein